MFAVGNTHHILNIKTQIVFSAPCLQHWKLLDPLSPHPAPSPPFHPPAAGAVMGGGCRLGQQIEPLARGVWGGMAPFPSLKLFNVGSTLPAFIGLSHLYSKIPSLSELVEPTSRFYWSFSSALGRWFEGGVPPKSIHWRAGAGPGWGDLAWFALPLRLLPSTLIHRCPLNHAAFTCLLIHKYTNTQIHNALL